MLNRRAVPYVRADCFYGVNTKDTNINMLPGEWHEDSINIVSSPQGAIGNRNGFAAITVTSIGCVTAVCGVYQYQKHSSGVTTKFTLLGGEDGWIYNYTGGKFTVVCKGLNTGDADDARFNFFTLDNKVTIIHQGQYPQIWDGTASSPLSHVSAVTADWGIEWQRYGFLHSVIDPRLLYYIDSVGNPDDAYGSFLNFDEDGEPLTGCGKQGDDLIVGKEHSLHRVQYRGTTPLFKKYRIPSDIGPVNFETVKTLPDGSLMFLAPDCNFYRLIGDTPFPVGDNIQPYIRGGVAARLQYAVSGLNYRKNQYWCSFTRVSGATQNDRTVVMDYNRPYKDIWGKLQYPWFIFDIAANAFGEFAVSGEDILYHGNYVGKIYKSDSGTDDDGTAIRTHYRSPSHNLGDPSIEKKFSTFEFSYQNKGDWNLDIGFVVDENASTQKMTTQNMQNGVTDAPLFDVAIFDTDSFATETDASVQHDIDLQGKTLYITFGTDGADETWNIYHYIFHARALKRTTRQRES